MLRLLRPQSSPEGDVGQSGRAEAAESRAADPLKPLAVLCRSGGAEAQRTLLVTVGPAMLRVVRGVLGSAHSDVEDVLQESMVALHLALPGFRGECSTLHFACRIAVQT